MKTLLDVSEDTLDSSDCGAQFGRELAELVDEWSVTPSGARAEDIAAEMIAKARAILRASLPLTKTATAG